MLRDEDGNLVVPRASINHLCLPLHRTQSHPPLLKERENFALKATSVEVKCQRERVHEMMTGVGRFESIR